MTFLGACNSNDVKLVVSDIELMIDVVDQMSSSEDTNFEVIIPESEARRVRLNFPLNSKIAELAKQNRLSLYSTDVKSLSNIMLDDSNLYGLARLGEIEQFAKSTDKDLSTKIHKEFTQIKSTGELIETDILAWSDLLTQLGETVGAETRREFERLIEAARIDDLGALDDISVAIIAAAQSGALLSDLGNWAEEVHLASKATFSRRKQSLEEEEIICTEKVPVEIGRPKQRLLLSDNIDDVGIQGDEIDVSKNEGWSKSYSVDTYQNSSESVTDQRDSEVASAGDDEGGSVENEELQILEKELKEAIRSN